LVGGIRDLFAADTSESGEGVFLRFGGADDFEHTQTANKEGIGDQRAVAAPRDRLGTHEGCWAFTGESSGVIESGGEFRRLHVVGVATKAVVAPAEID